jgi:hypothetical protein
MIAIRKRSRHEGFGEKNKSSQTGTRTSDGYAEIGYSL